MLGDLGKSQLSSLLETVPGLASVLRSPVADAIVNMIRAGAGLRDFDVNDAKELVQYATRRGLVPSAEGAALLDEVKGLGKKSRAKPKAAKKKAPVVKSAAKAAKKKTAVVTKVKASKKKAAAPKAKTAKKKAARTKAAEKTPKKTVKKASKKKPAKKQPAKKKAAKKGRR